MAEVTKENLKKAIDETQKELTAKTDAVTVNYRTWMYNRLDGKMESFICEADKAQEFYDAGWRLSPAEFTTDPRMADDEQFVATADDMAALMNRLINIDKIEDEDILRDIAVNFLQMTVADDVKLDQLRHNIKAEAIKKGVLNTADSEPAPPEPAAIPAPEKAKSGTAAKPKKAK